MVRKGRFLVQGTLHSIPYGLNDNVRKLEMFQNRVLICV